MFTKSSNVGHRLVVIGGGDVVQKKVAPAVCNLQKSGMVTDVVYCDTKDNALGEKWSHLPFMKIQDPRKIVEQLGELGWLGLDVLVLVCTPSAYHVEYAIALADHVGHIGVEKPLALTVEDAERLIPIAHKVTPIEHQVYKQALIDLCMESREGVLDWSAVRQARFWLHEDSGVGQRKIDDLIFDTGYHGLACVVAALSQKYSDPEILVCESQVSTYFNGPDLPRKCTAALIRGSIVTDGPEFSFEISVGKGFPKSEKGLMLHLDGQSPVCASLNEAGHMAHQRVIEHILNPDRPSPLLGLRDSISIVRACSEALENAVKKPGYEFGSFPIWDRSLVDLSRTETRLQSALVK